MKYIAMYAIESYVLHKNIFFKMFDYLVTLVSLSILSSELHIFLYEACTKKS